MTMVNRNPRQIAGFDVALDKSANHIQNMVDHVHPMLKSTVLMDTSVIWMLFSRGGIFRNIHNQSDTFTVEGINADLRHYIPILAWRSRCFARSLETLHAVVEAFVDAYNHFGLAKFKYRLVRPSGEVSFGLVDFL